MLLSQSPGKPPRPDLGNILNRRITLSADAEADLSILVPGVVAAGEDGKALQFSKLSSGKFRIT